MAGCSVTLAYLKEVKSALTTMDPNAIIWGDVIEQAADLIERAEVVTGLSEFQRLRAFYCVEMMYSTFIREALSKDKVLTKHPGSDIALAPIIIGFTGPVDRSWEGLGQLIERVDNLDGELAIRLAELAFSKKTKYGESELVLMENRFEVTMKVFELCAESAKALRRSLNKDAPKLAPIGKAMAAAAGLLQIPYSNRLSYGLVLLNISPNNAVTAWQNSKFQE